MIAFAQTESRITIKNINTILLMSLLTIIVDYIYHLGNASPFENV